MDHIVEAGLRDLAAEDGLLQRIAEEVVVAGLVHVEAGERGLDGGVGATPVGEDEAFEAPVVLEDLVQGVVVLAGVVAVDVVVGAHDAGGLARVMAIWKASRSVSRMARWSSSALRMLRPVSWSLRA